MRKLFYALMACGLFVASCNGVKKTGNVDRSIPLGYEGVYRVQPIDSQTWLIDESGSATIYLVTGTEKALLIDAGIGTGDLRGLVNTLTSLPVTLVNTHGHIDHIGADYLYDEVHLSLSDTALYNEFYNKQNRLQNIRYFMDQHKEFKMTEKEVDHMVNIPSAKVIDLKEGDVFDLGGRKLEVVAIPGHTAGSVLFFDRSHKYVFTGDAINVHCWMWLPESLPLDTFENAIRRVCPMLDGIERIYNGHETVVEGLPVSHVDTIIRHIEEIKSGVLLPDTVEVYGNRVPVYIFDDWRILLKK